MIIFRSFFLTILASSSLVFSVPQDSITEENLDSVLNSQNKQNDDTVINSVVSQLNQTLSSNDKCNSCVERLLIGKTLANTRPDLVSSAFTKWCLEAKGLSKSTCIEKYGLSTVYNSSQGANFADMLVEINPLAYEGQLYCYYKESKSCPKPATPNITVSHMWPPKSPQHMVAPEPGMNGTFNVLHISDLHIELDYSVGSETNCTDTICCTPFSKNSVKQNETSSYNGYWNSFFNSSYNEDFSFSKGDLINVFDNSSIFAPATSFGNYECDSPELLINASLNSVINYTNQQNITFDFSLFTGDMVDHDAAERISLETTIQSEEYIFRDIKSRLGSIPVFPVLGNHDTFPYAELAPEQYSYSNKFTWNAELMADIWEDYGWVTPEAAQYARKHYTGYAVETRLGLKVISLNSNTWYLKNTYSYLNATQPDNFGQFEFLIEELLASEAKNQRVWITAHIPPASAGLPIPANILAEIIERFSPSTIAGIFFGHTHEDQFQILYAGSGNDTKTINNVINNAFIGPSITPWGGINPSWRYYEVDKTTFSVMNVHNFYTPLNETYTNNGHEPQWKHEYAARNAYNVSWPATSPLNGTFWHLVAEQVKDSVDVRQLYERYAKRLSPYVSNCYNSTDCDGDYCFLSTFRVDDYDSCMAALPK